jgi:hypothetical protein
MSLAHPESEALESYVIGAHDQISVREIEAHLRVCESCVEEVRRQVQVDLAMVEVAEGAAFCPGCGGLLASPRCSLCGAVAAVGGFRVERVLVQNAHGRMYLARDGAGQPVALKELAFVQAPDREALEAFEREARLLRQLSHPQIPRFLAAFRDGEGVHARLYLAQEYVEGESLQARLGRHQFSEEEAREVAEQVLGILEYLQCLAPMVFHRDIKPANLIRRPDGRIALVDFGAARDLGPTVGATLVGTFGYMPLEQLGGIVDATTDLYGLGATLSHLLSRREPWSFLEDPQALGRLNVSPGFRDWLGKLMARRAADRWPSAAAAAAALREPRPPKRRWALPRLRPSWGVGLAVAFVLSLGMAAAFLVMPAPGVREARLARGREAMETLEIERAAESAEIIYPFSMGPKTYRARVPLPPGLAGMGPQTLLAKVCASADGDVVEVSVQHGVHPSLQAEVVERLKRLKFPRQEVVGRRVPFCRQVRYVLEPTAAPTSASPANP